LIRHLPAHPGTTSDAPRAVSAGRRLTRQKSESAFVAAVDQGRRSLRNFSRKRPETTNLNHQKAIRRAVIGSILAG
jgi:hypothetical protein